MLKIRLVIGIIICVGVAIWMVLSEEVSENPAPAIVVLTVGLALIATSKLKRQ